MRCQSCGRLQCIAIIRRALSFSSVNLALQQVPLHRRGSTRLAHRDHHRCQFTQQRCKSTLLGPACPASRRPSHLQEACVFGFLQPCARWPGLACRHRLRQTRCRSCVAAALTHPVFAQCGALGTHQRSKPIPPCHVHRAADEGAVSSNSSCSAASWTKIPADFTTSAPNATQNTTHRMRAVVCASRASSSRARKGEAHQRAPREGAGGQGLWKSRCRQPARQPGDLRCINSATAMATVAIGCTQQHVAPGLSISTLLALLPLAVTASSISVR